ncbi:MAG TPA: L,D-transpeptidase family protein [Gaiellaceae bacterium]|nr:L,D-transpeptidase family protein [Gaiellaceae bacterium]
MRRAGLVLSSLIVLALAGAGAASVLADTPPPAGTGTDTSTAATTTTTAAPATIPGGIVLGGVAVGGMTTDAAAEALQEAYGRPVVLRLGRTTIRVAPGALGMRLPVDSATQRAMTVSENSILRLRAGVDKDLVRAYVARLAKRYDRPVRDAGVVLHGIKPSMTTARPGVALHQRWIANAIETEIAEGTREPIVMKVKTVQPTVTNASIGPVIVIQRGSNVLTLYHQTRFVRRFRVATGQAIYPTPLGEFHIVVMWKNPWWYPPNDPWAAGEKPTPPGPGNPLGTRWMGLSAPGVGIHGTPESGSIGYSESHGCIRMLIPEAEWLFDHVKIGTPVFIVAS